MNDGDAYTHTILNLVMAWRVGADARPDRDWVGYTKRTIALV